MTDSVPDPAAELHDSAAEIGGRAASAPSRNAEEAAGARVVTCAAPCRPAPEARARVDVAELTRSCLALAAEMFDRREVPGADRLGEVRAAAVRWAREGVPLGTVLRACHEGLRIAFGPITARAAGEEGSRMLAATELALELLEVVTVAAADSYVDEQDLVAREHQSARQTLASALLSGHGGSALARQAGMPIAGAYQVVALSIPEHTEEHDPRADPAAAARRTLRRLQSAMATGFRSRALALLSVTGGTLLIPIGDEGPVLTPELLEALSEAARVPLTATAVDSATDEVPDSADQAHELLELVRVGDREPGLYRMADLAVEYQLTRGGPATHRIATILDPLDAHPELFDTLRAYLGNDMNRRQTARQLYVHPNTVDYRLRRIAQLTPLDLATTAGISQASIALLARDLDRGPSRRL